MPSLLEVQHAIRRSLIERDDEAAVSNVVAEGLAPKQRLAVYRNTFDGNLTNALRLSYPVVHRLVGAEFFEGAAQIFCHQHPPRAAHLDAYGAEFPDFLAGFPPAASLAYLADVARLEWAVSSALHAPDAEPIDANQLAGLNPADHDRIQFVVDPSITLLRVDYPADTIWRAVLAQDDAMLDAIDLMAGPVWLLIERRVTGIEVTHVEESTWRFSNSLFAGQPLGAAIEHTNCPEAATTLAEHIGAGRFIAYRMAEPNDSVLPSEIAA